MKFTKRMKNWMAWLVAIIMVLCASPAVFAEAPAPSGGQAAISSVQYSKGSFSVRFSGLKNAQQASKVQFKVWSTATQSDARWYDAVKQSNGSYAATVSIYRHNYAGVYQVEVYVTDTNKNVRCHARTTCNMSGSAGIKIKYSGDNIYTATISRLKYPGSYKKVRFGVWSLKNGQDDLRWYTAVKKGSKYYVTVRLNKHRHLGRYYGNLCVVDRKGKFHYACMKSFKVAEPRGGRVSLTSVNVSQGTLTARMTGIKGKSRMKKVRFKVYSNAGNVRWYTAKKNKKNKNVYTAKISISKHGGNRGVYNIEGYTVDIKNDYKYHSKVLRSMALPKGTTKRTPVIYARTAASTNKYARKLGVDVSHWNGNVNWAKVKSDGVQFAIIRTSDSTGTMDRQWVNNVKGCAANKIPFGVYIYSRAKTKKKAAQEANVVLSRLSEVSARPTYPIYLDLEDPKDMAPLSNAKLATITAEFARVIKAAGYTPGVYSSLSWWNNKLTDPSFNQYPRWVAQWPISYKSSSKCGYTKGAYKIWQFSDNGRVSGMSGAVDLNWMY